MQQSFGVPNYLRVRDAIRSDIARGVLGGGSRLKISELATRYQLSPAPIREALNQLEAEGWIVMSPNKGARVREINDAVLRELNEIRIAVESYIVRLAAERATPANIAVLEAIQAEFEATLRNFKVETLVEINVRFHAAILAIWPNGEASAILKRYSVFFSTMRIEWGYHKKRPQQEAAEHRALIGALRDNDGSTAEQLVRTHIQNAMDDLLARRREGRVQTPAAGEG